MKDQPTNIRFIKNEQRHTVTCWLCGAEGLHPYWDPESNGFICQRDIGPVLVSEQVLLSIQGICRPHVHVPKTTKR